MNNSVNRGLVSRFQSLVKEFYPEDREYQTLANDCLYDALEPNTLRFMLYHFHEQEVKNLLKQHQPLFKVVQGKIITNQIFWEN